jgi:uracil phosphoribosyltransferase
MLHDHTNEPLLQLHVNETRQETVNGSKLADAHRAVGRDLSAHLAQCLTIENYEIGHPTGNKSDGRRVTQESKPIIIAMLRSGLFLAEGIYSSIPGSAMVLYKSAKDLEDMPKGKNLIVVDAVINTGKSIREILAHVEKFEPSHLMVASLVASKEGLTSLINEFPKVDFHIARVSENSYTGKGSTDTGARLFGTTTWPEEEP